MVRNLAVNSLSSQRAKVFEPITYTLNVTGWLKLLDRTQQPKHCCLETGLASKTVGAFYTGLACKHDWACTKLQLYANPVGWTATWILKVI